MGGKNPCEGPSLLASVPYLRNLPRLRKGRGDISWKGVFVVWTAVWGASFENDGGGGRRSSRRVCDKDDSTNGRTLLPSPPFFVSDRGELSYLRDRLSRLPARNDAIIAPWLRSKIIDGSYYIVAGMELSRRGVETSWDSRNYRAFTFSQKEKLEIRYDDRFKFLLLRLKRESYERYNKMHAVS